MEPFVRLRKQFIEALLESPLAQDDRNRVRRNLEGFRPVTLSKSADTFAFFKKIMVRAKQIQDYFATRAEFVVYELLPVVF